MKRFKHLANLCERCKKAYVDHQCEKYCDLILTGQLRIWDVPLKWRRNPNVAKTLYIAEFRVARGTSLERYEEDLRKLDFELLVLELEESHDPLLLKQLRGLYADRKEELKYLKRREAYENVVWQTLQREMCSV